MFLIYYCLIKLYFLYRFYVNLLKGIYPTGFSVCVLVPQVLNEYKSLNTLQFLYFSVTFLLLNVGVAAWNELSFSDQNLADRRVDISRAAVTLAAGSALVWSAWDRDSWVTSSTLVVSESSWSVRSAGILDVSPAVSPSWCWFLSWPRPPWLSLFCGWVSFVWNWELVRVVVQFPSPSVLIFTMRYQCCNIDLPRMRSYYLLTVLRTFLAPKWFLRKSFLFVCFNDNFLLSLCLLLQKYPTLFQSAVFISFTRRW